MAITLNKTVKTNIVNAAIEAKFKGQYEKMFRVFEKAVFNYVLKGSQHEAFAALNLPPEMLSHVTCKHSAVLYNGINVDQIKFIGQRSISSVRFDHGVYGDSGGHYIKRDGVKEIVKLESLVKEILHEQDVLTSVIMSYRNIKKLITDLPWVEKYLPTETTPTGLIAVDVLNDINAKFGK